MPQWEVTDNHTGDTFTIDADETPSQEFVTDYLKKQQEEKDKDFDSAISMFNRLHAGPSAPPPSLAPVRPPTPQQPEAAPEIEPPKMGPYRQAFPKNWQEMAEGVGGPMRTEQERTIEQMKEIHGEQDTPTDEFFRSHPELKPSAYGILGGPTDIPAPRMSKSEAKALGLPDFLAGVASGTQEAIADFVDFTTSTMGIGTALTGGVAGEASAMAQLPARMGRSTLGDLMADQGYMESAQTAGKTGSGISKGMTTAFAADMAKNLPDQFEAITEAIKKGDTAAATRGTLNAAMTLWVMKHGAEANVRPDAPVERAARPGEEGPIELPTAEAAAPLELKESDFPTELQRPEIAAAPRPFFDRQSEALGLGRPSTAPTVEDVRAQRAAEATPTKELTPPTVPGATFDSVWELAPGKKMLQYTFRGLGEDPAQGMTFYVPEGSTAEVAIQRANEKLAEFKSEHRVPDPAADRQRIDEIQSQLKANTAAVKSGSRPAGEAFAANAALHKELEKIKNRSFGGKTPEAYDMEKAEKATEAKPATATPRVSSMFDTLPPTVEDVRAQRALEGRHAEDEKARAEGVIAKGPTKDNPSKDNAEFRMEWRARKLTPDDFFLTASEEDRMRMDPKSAWVVEQRRVDIEGGKETPGKWQYPTLGKSKGDAIRNTVGSTDFEQARSLDETHSEVVSRVKKLDDISNQRAKLQAQITPKDRYTPAPLNREFQERFDEELRKRRLTKKAAEGKADQKIIDEIKKPLREEFFKRKAEIEAEIESLKNQAEQIKLGKPAPKEKAEAPVKKESISSENDRIISELRDQLKSIAQRRKEVRKEFAGVKPISLMNRTTPRIERGQALQRALDNLELEERGVNSHLQKLISEKAPIAEPATAIEKRATVLPPDTKIIPPNSAFIKVVNYDGQTTGIVVFPHDGTTEGIRKASAEAGKYADENFAWKDEFYNTNSQRGATDPDGKVKWVVSPNLSKISEVGTPEAAYTLGDIEAFAKDRAKRAMDLKKTGDVEGANKTLMEQISELDQAAEKHERYAAKNKSDYRKALKKKKAGVSVKSLDDRATNWKSYLENLKRHIDWQTKSAEKYRFEAERWKSKLTKTVKPEKTEHKKLADQIDQAKEDFRDLYEKANKGETITQAEIDSAIGNLNEAQKRKMTAAIGSVRRIFEKQQAAPERAQRFQEPDTRRVEAGGEEETGAVKPPAAQPELGLKAISKTAEVMPKYPPPARLPLDASTHQEKDWLKIISESRDNPQKRTLEAMGLTQAQLGQLIKKGFAASGEHGPYITSDGSWQIDPHYRASVRSVGQSGNFNKFLKEELARQPKPLLPEKQLTEPKPEPPTAETRLSPGDKPTIEEKKFRATVEGQKAMASRASRIATLSQMNEAIRKIDPNEAYPKDLLQTIPDDQIDKWRDGLIATWNKLKKPTAETSNKPVVKPAEVPAAEKPTAPKVEPPKAEPPKPPVIAPPAEEGGGGGQYGIAERVRAERAAAGQVEPVERGEGVSAEDAVQRGRDILAADPQAGEKAMAAFEADGTLLKNANAVTRAHGEQLAKTAEAMRKEHGDKSPEYLEAKKALSDWDKRTKKLQTAWHEAGMEQQGATDLDTGNFVEMERAYEEGTGKKLEGDKKKTVEDMTERKKKVDEEVEKGTNELANEIARKTMTDAERAAFDAANKTVREWAIRRAKAENKQRVADEKLRQATRQVQEDAKARAEAIRRKTTRSAEQRAAAAENLARAKAAKLAKEVADIEVKRVRQRQEVIWKRTRDAARAAAAAVRKDLAMSSHERVLRKAREYIEDLGMNNLDEIRNKIATDLGMKVDEVTRLLAKDPKVKFMMDSLWTKKQTQRKLQQAAKRWLRDQSVPWVAKALRAVPRLMFGLKVGFHGTVALGTHAPTLAFDPRFWKMYASNYAKMYRLAGFNVPTPKMQAKARAYYESQVQDLIRRTAPGLKPGEKINIYDLARRAGLQNDPFQFEELTTEGQTGLANTMGRKLSRPFAEAYNAMADMGNRGYSVLKFIRQDMFDYHWNRLPNNLKSLEMAKSIADAVNHATGVTKAKGPPGSEIALFAPRLAASRIAFLAVDPIRAAKTFANWKNASKADKWFATEQIKSKATLAATYMGLLALNQGFLSATKSEQQINMSDPFRADYLKFKLGGLSLSYGNPILTLMRLPIRLWGARSPTKGRFSNLMYPDESMGRIAQEYIRSQLSPAASTATTLFTKADFQHRPLPGSDLRMPKRLRQQGVEPYTWKEFVLETAAPIPVEEAMREVFRTGMGMSHEQEAQTLKAIATLSVMLATGARVNEDLPYSGDIPPTPMP